MIGIVAGNGDIAWLANYTDVNLYKANQVKEILAKKYPEDNFKICKIERNWEGEYECKELRRTHKS